MWIFECRDPSYEAFKFGLAAVVMLCLAHIVANLLAGCVFISSKEELDRASPNKQLAAASLMMSWYLIIRLFSTVFLDTVETNGGF